MTTDLLAVAVARSGKVGCGAEDQAREVVGGWRVARGDRWRVVGVGMVSICVVLCLKGCYCACSRRVCCVMVKLRG
jgi:hypothetical protein